MSDEYLCEWCKSPVDPEGDTTIFHEDGVNMTHLKCLKESRAISAIFEGM